MLQYRAQNMARENYQPISLMVNIADSPAVDTKKIGTDVGGGAVVTGQLAIHMGERGYPIKVITDSGNHIAIERPFPLSSFPGQKEIFIQPRVIELPMFAHLTTRYSTPLEDEQWAQHVKKMLHQVVSSPENRHAVPFAHYYLAGKLLGTICKENDKPFIFMPHSLQRISDYFQNERDDRKYSEERDRAEAWTLFNAEIIIVSTEAEKNLIANLYSSLEPSATVDLATPQVHEPKVGHTFKESTDFVLANHFLKKTIVIPLGVDHHKFNLEINKPENKLSARRKFHLPEDAEMVFGTLSRINGNKNLGTVIEAFAQTRKTTKKKIALAVFGGNIEEIKRPGTYLYNLQKKAQELGVENEIYFLGSQKPEEALAAIDTFICASFYESFSLATTEAMACAKPCLLSDIPTLREVSHNSQLYFDPFNPNDLTDKMLTVLFTSPASSFSDIGRQAEKASQQYSWENTARMVTDQILGLGKRRDIFTGVDISDIRKERPMSKEELEIMKELRENRIDLANLAEKILGRVSANNIIYSIKLSSPLSTPFYIYERLLYRDFKHKKKSLQEDYEYYQVRLKAVAEAEEALRVGDYDGIISYFQELADRLTSQLPKIHTHDQIAAKNDLAIMEQRIAILTKLKEKYEHRNI